MRRSSLRARPDASSDLWLDDQTRRSDRVPLQASSQPLAGSVFGVQQQLSSARVR